MTMPEQTSKNVMAAITDGRVKMHSRWFFRLRFILTVALLVIIALAVIWYNSFVLFALDHSGRFFLLTLGGHGLSVFLSSVPWLVLFYGIILSILLAWLIYRGTKAYRWPIGFGFVMIIIGAGAVGYAVSFTPFQQLLHRSSIDRDMPLFGGLYKQWAETEPVGSITGIVTTLSDQGFMILDRDLDLDAVIVNQGVKLDRPIVVNDVVLVVGDEKDEIIQAESIRHLSERYRTEILEKIVNTPSGE
jgi:hypothetical protein